MRDRGVVWTMAVFASLALAASLPPASGLSQPARRSALLSDAVGDRALAGHVVGRHSHRSFLSCAAACLADGRCSSVNYEVGGGGACEVNGANRRSQPGDMEARVGWVHYGQVLRDSTEDPCTQVTTDGQATILPSATTQQATTQQATTQATTQQATTQTTTQQATTQTTTQQATTQATTHTTTQQVTTQQATTQATTQQATTQATTTTVVTTTEYPSIDCWDIHSRSPSSGSGVYTVFPETREDSLSVACDMTTDGGGWTVFQRRQDAAQDFYLGWADYKAGFGDPAANVWLGNDALHQLTAQRVYRLRIELHSFDGAETHAEYGSFSIGNEATNYELSLGTFGGSPTAGDAFALHHGQQFSTNDRDNDGDGSRSCAEVSRGAWWYDACESAALNGPYQDSEPLATGGQGVVWGTWLGVFSALRFAEMKVRPLSDCWDYYSAGNTESGVYTIWVAGIPEGLSVYCDMTDVGGGWTVIQRRVDGTVDFYNDWATYKAGFGNLEGNFWLGNDNIHSLTSQDSYQLTVKLQTWDPITKYANYGVFSVAGEADSYRLSVGQFFGSLGVGDSLGEHTGEAWSTRDRDNDATGERHCAQVFSGAWWYMDCQFTNLNGPYVDSPGTPASPGLGITWGTWTFQSYSMQSAEMKIRPAHVGFTLP